MSQFWSYFNLGLEHVLDGQAYDHILFIVVLVTVYSFTEWKKIIRLLSVFTAGYLLSLNLAGYEVVIVKTSLVEFLIPLTILFTAIYNLFTAGKKTRNGKTQLLYIATLFFGPIHGLGFSGYFRTVSKNSSEKALPLLEFALGIEAAIILIVVVILLLSFLFQFIFRFSRRDWILVISSIAIGLTIPVLMESIFW